MTLILIARVAPLAAAGLLLAAYPVLFLFAQNLTEVGVGETYEIAFVADNPGLWMDHCHNLDHAASGMVMHLAYRGITSPFELGGDHGNSPE